MAQSSPKRLQRGCEKLNCKGEEMENRAIHEKVGPVLLYRSAWGHAYGRQAKRVVLSSPFSVYINGVELWDREVLFKNLLRMKRRETR